MIIGCDVPHEIGKQYNGTIYDDDLVKHENVPFVVIRQSSFDEWFETKKELNLTQAQLKRASLGFFYLVSTD